MAGNAAEWVADWYDEKYYVTSPVKNPSGPEAGKFRVFRGGSYLSLDQELTTMWRGVANSKQLQDGVLPDGRPIIGIRCAKSLEMSLR
jgi:iron(II)-dependent oxidoreductase